MGHRPLRYDIQFLSINNKWGVLWPVTSTCFFVVFDVSRAATARPGSASYPLPRSPDGRSARSTTISMRCRTPTCCARRNAPPMAHTAKLRNRIGGLSDRSGRCRRIRRGFPGSWAQAPPVVGRDLRIPGSGRVGDGEHRQRPAHDLPVVKDVGCQDYLGVACIRSWPTPAIDDFTSKQAAIVGLAKLTDASRCARYCRLSLRPTTPPTRTSHWIQQRAKRSLRLSARANGMWRSPDARRGRRGDPGREPGIVHRPRTPRHHHPAQRRADALTDMSRPRRPHHRRGVRSVHPGGFGEPAHQ